MSLPERLILHLGVINQPYRTGGMTTGDVAQILEAKYHLFETFERAHRQRIMSEVEQIIKDAGDALMAGRPGPNWQSPIFPIGRLFQDFITSGAAERAGIPGTPTKAALKGINHRYKHPYRSSNPRRPSFRDTGLLSNNGIAWLSKE